MTKVADIVRDGTTLIPGAREAGKLMRFAGPVAVIAGSTTMDAATILERQREGGGAPSERRPARPPFEWRHPIRWAASFL